MKYGLFCVCSFLLLSGCSPQGQDTSSTQDLPNLEEEQDRGSSTTDPDQGLETPVTPPTSPAPSPNLPGVPRFPADPDAPSTPPTLPPPATPGPTPQPEPPPTPGPTPPPPKSYTKQTLEVSVTSITETDILFVVDNSGSMRQEQQGLAAKIDGFMNLIKDLNWQVGLTTTDPNANTRDSQNSIRPWGDGQLRSFDQVNGSQYVLRSGADESLESAQQKLATAIQVGIRGSGSERGINATHRAIERSLNSASAQRDLLRLNSRLAVVLISDEDECSNGGCLQNNPKSRPENLIELVRNQFGPEKVFQFHSIIFRPNDQSCSTGYNQGHNYARLTELTGGIMGSVCDNDYTSILSDMGQRVVDLVNSANLSCRAADTDGDGTANVVVTLADGSVIRTGLRVEGTTLLFGRDLPEGKHQIEYYCED